MAERPEPTDQELPQTAVQRYIYHGPSMTPTFRAGSILYVRPQMRGLTAGDVIVFRDTSSQENIVHRVVAVHGDELITRGDHNALNDELPVQPEQIFGKVERVQIGLAEKPVQGGQRGWRQAQLQRALQHLSGATKRVLGIPYRLLRRSGLVARFWHPVLTQVNFQENGICFIKYIHRRRTIAIWYPAQGRFECRKPYDLALRAPGQIP